MYRARVGDVIEYDGYIGIIHQVLPPRSRGPNDETEIVKLDWIAGTHPECDFRQSHSDADWYPVSLLVQKFKFICNVHEK